VPLSHPSTRNIIQLIRFLLKKTLLLVSRIPAFLLHPFIQDGFFEPPAVPKFKSGDSFQGHIFVQRIRGNTEILRRLFDVHYFFGLCHSLYPTLDMSLISTLFFRTLVHFISGVNPTFLGFFRLFWYYFRLLFRFLYRILGCQLE
jgi:hypothetical protein